MMLIALRSDGPAESSLSQLVEDAGNQAGALKRMWSGGNLTVRAFVMNHLRTRLHAEPSLINRMDDIVREAARDPDLYTREPALIILAESDRPEFQRLLRQQLTDPDPAVRVLVLQQLQRFANSNDVPAVIGLLDDSDPRVVVQAAGLLRKTTGLDFGIRVTHALPRFNRSEGEQSPLEPNLEAIQNGVRRWREWWGLHSGEFPEPAKWQQIATAALPLEDFSLEHLDGRKVRLSDVRGKTVLLCFWKTGQSANFDDLAALKQLQNQESDRLAIMGVAFDPAVGPQDDCGGHEGHAHGQEHHHDHAHMTDSSPRQLSLHCVVQDLISQMRISFPVLLDKKGTAVFRFNVQEAPTYALVDAQGNLRRRFVGSRSLTVFKAMVDEAAADNGASPKGISVSASTPGRFLP